MYRAAQLTYSSPCDCLSKPPYFARLNSCFAVRFRNTASSGAHFPTLQQNNSAYGRAVYVFFFLSKTATLSALFPAGLFCFVVVVVVVVVVVFKPNATQKIEVDKTTETSE